MSHVGHSRGARWKQDTYICHMWGILEEQDGSGIYICHMWDILEEQDGSKIYICMHMHSRASQLMLLGDT